MKKTRVNVIVVGFFCLVIGMIVTNPAMLYPEASGTFIITDAFVGINTSTPMYELDVNGTVRANNFIGDGSQITGIIGGGGIWHNNSGTAYYYNDVEVENNITAKKIIGDQITFGRFLLSSYGGTIDAGGDPWYISDTSVQMAENLTVDHNITSSGYFIGDGSQLTGISGASLWSENITSGVTWLTNTSMNTEVDGYLTLNSGRLIIYPIDAWENPLNIYESIGGDSAVTVQVNGNNQNSLNIKNNNANTVKINGNGDSYFNGGDIGIGTTTPSAKLDISDGSNSRSIINITEDGNTKTSLSLYDNNGQKKTEFSVSGIWNTAKLYTLAGNFEFWVDGWKKATLSGNKLEFINSFPIEVEQVNAVDSDGLKLYDDDGNGIFIEDGGKVGIGTVSPSAMLDVEVTSGGAATIGSSVCTASGDYAVAFGSSRATGVNSFSLGQGLASGTNSFALGTATACGYHSFAMGYGSTNSSGMYSFAGGFESESIGSGSLAFGTFVRTFGLDAVATGRSATAFGNYSFATGRSTNASGERSFTMGHHSIASGDSSFTGGKYMQPSSGYGTFVWGNSSSVQAFSPADNRFLIFPQGDTGRVGIGTTAPNAELHVVGNATITNTVTIGNILHLTPLASAPGSPAEGYIYYNSVNHKAYCYDGTVWQGMW